MRAERPRRYLDQTRRYLDQNLFPDAPPPPAVTWRRAFVCLGLAVLAIAIQLIRMWSSRPLNSMWAEDGAVWLTDAMGRGLLDALTTTWNGYLQTTSRLLAEPVAWLPVRSFAPIMAICGAAIVTGSAFVVWRASAGHIRSAVLRAVLAAMVILLPVVGAETLDNVTNSIWFLLFASFWLLLWRPATLARAIAAAVFIFLTALTNAGIVVFAPLWLLRTLAIRDRRDAVIVSGFAAGTAIQLAYSWNAPVRGEGGTHLSPVAAALFAPHWDWSLLPAYSQRIVGGALAGQRLNSYLWDSIGTGLEVFLGLALLAFVAFAIASGTRTRVVVPILVGASLGLFLTAGYTRWYPIGASFHWRQGGANASNAHYMVTPILLLLSALFVALDAGSGFVRQLAWGRVRVGTVIAVIAVALASFNVGNQRTRGSPSWSAALDAGRVQCVRANTMYVKVQIQPKFGGRLPIFFVKVPCSKLTG